MKYIYFCLLMMVSLIASSQSFSFENHIPLWHHLSLTEMQHESDLIYSSLNPVIKNDDLYLTHTLNFFDGHLLEKVDLNSGELVWKKSVLGKDGLNREFPNLPYIDSDNNINMLVFRQKEVISGFKWSKALFGYRKYDIETGVVIDSSFASRNDSSALELSMPILLFVPWPFKSFLEPTFSQDSFNYIKHVAVGGKLTYQYYKLDKKGRFSSFYDVISSFESGNKILRNVTSKKVNLDSSIVLKHAIEFNKDKSPYSLNLDIIIKKGKEVDIVQIDLKNKVSPAIAFSLAYADESNFIVTANDSIQGLQEDRFYNFDYDGNLIETISVKSTIGDTRYAVSNPILLKKNGKMFLIVSKDKNGKQTEYFLRSDGFGNLTTVSELNVLSQDTEISTRRIIEIDENRLLVNFLYPDFSEEKYKVWSNWIMFSKEQLGMLTSIKEEVIEEMSIYPNPVSDILRISNYSQKNENYEIFDNLGKTIIKSNLKNNQIDVSSLSPGIYLIRFKIDKTQKTIRFVKK